MIKTVLKLLLAALIANAAWRVGSAYIAFYKFQDAVTVRRENEHTYVDGSYQRQLEILPGYRYPWVFTLHVNTMSFEGARLPSPQK